MARSVIVSKGAVIDIDRAAWVESFGTTRAEILERGIIGGNVQGIRATYGEIPEGAWVAHPRRIEYDGIGRIPLTYQRAIRRTLESRIRRVGE